jgi:hypothetical protein
MTSDFRLRLVLADLVASENRPIIALQESAAYGPDGHRHAELRQLLGMIRYNFFFRLTATRADGGRAFHKGGVLVLVPTELVATDVGFPLAIAQNAALTNVDMCTVELPQLGLRVTGLYAHPTDLTTEHIMAALRLTPANSVIAADFNFSLAPELEPRRTDASTVLGFAMQNRLLQLGACTAIPDQKTTRASFIDGFITTAALPCIAPTSASVLRPERLRGASDPGQPAIGDHWPVALYLDLDRGNPDAPRFVPPSVMWSDIQPRHRTSYSTAVLNDIANGTPIEQALVGNTNLLPRTKGGTQTLRTMDGAAFDAWVSRLIRAARSHSSESTWALVNSFFPGRNTRQVVFDGQDRWLTDAERADGFARRFAAIYRPAADATPPLPDPLPPVPPLSRDEIAWAIGRGRPGAAADKHGISARLLKCLTPEAAWQIFAPLFDAAVRGHPPETWGCVMKAAVPKPSKPLPDSKSYRPVSIVDELFKAVDRVVTMRLTAAVFANGAVHPSQFAARRKLPACLQVAATVQFAHDGIRKEHHFYAREQPQDPAQPRVRLRRREATLMVLIDQSDAYCLVPASAVCDSLRVHGLASFIPYVVGISSNRSFFVRSGDCKSAHHPLTSGLLQGLSGSPVEYCVGTTPISEAAAYAAVRPTCLLDDVNLITRAAVPNEYNDPMGRAAENIGRVFTDLGLKLSDKSRALLINGSRRPFTHPQSDHVDFGQHGRVPIINLQAGFFGAGAAAGSEADDRAKTVRHLGLFVDTALRFGKHFRIKLREARAALREIECLSFRLPAHALRSVFLSKCVSILLYGVEVWYTRVSPSNRARAEQFMAAGARLITGCSITCPGVRVVAAAGLRSFAWYACRAIVNLDELAIRLSPFLQPDGSFRLQAFDQGTQDRLQGHEWAAYTILCPRELNIPDPGAGRTFAYFAQQLRGNGPPFAQRDALLRSPAALTTPADFLNAHGLDLSSVTFQLNNPSGLSSYDSRADRGAANAAKLEADTRRNGEPRFEGWFDGSADLEHFGGSAAAWAIWGAGSAASDPPLRSGSTPAGNVSCSYSAEGHGAIGLLRDFAQMARDGTLSAGDAIRINSDSQSFLAALAPGPFDQDQWLEIEAMKLIIELAHGYRIAIRFLFLFSHTDDNPRSDFVDALAGQTRRQRGLDPVPLRPCDCVNVRMRFLPPYPNAPRCPLRGTVLTPSASLRRFNLIRRDEIFLCRLRTGVCANIGSVINGQPTACKLCGALVMCRLAAVLHVFECQNTTAVQGRVLRTPAQAVRPPDCSDSESDSDAPSSPADDDRPLGSRPPAANRQLAPADLWRYPVQCVTLAKLFAIDRAEAIGEDGSSSSSSSDDDEHDAPSAAADDENSSAGEAGASNLRPLRTNDLFADRADFFQLGAAVRPSPSEA